MSLLHKIPREKALQALKEQKRLLDKEYSVLEQGRNMNETAEQEIPLLSEITIDNMFAILRMQQQLIEKLLKVLEV